MANLLFAAILLGLALLALFAAVRLRRASGLPWATVASSDTGAERHLTRPLFARRIGLTGKPDYVLELRGAYVPVEVKPTRRAEHPYEADLMQLATYCLLLEETSGRAPPYGLLRYAEHSFRLDYTPAVRRDVLAIVAEMRALLDEDDCARSHDEPQRCAGCGFRALCEDALV